VYGATLEAAALARIEEQLRGATGVDAIAQHIERALRAGYHHLADELCTAAATAAAHEPVFAKLGDALHRLAVLQATEPLPAGHGLGALLRTVIERALWVLEGIDGADALFDRQTIDGIAAIRAALDLELPDFATLAEMCAGVWTRRAAAPTAPPAVRGACLGALWTSAELRAAITGTPPHDYRTDASDAVRGVTSDLLGELLAGLFALAREAFSVRLQPSAVESASRPRPAARVGAGDPLGETPQGFRESDLLSVVDARLGELDEHEFLTTLPALRRAFAFFPPEERRHLARTLLARRQLGADPHALLAPVAEPDAVASARALEERWLRTAAKYGLLAKE
jgi:hypothetical protein